jgi:hypothetical protein
MSEGTPRAQTLRGQTPRAQTPRAREPELRSWSLDAEGAPARAYCVATCTPMATKWRVSRATALVLAGSLGGAGGLGALTVAADPAVALSPPALTSILITKVPAGYRVLPNKTSHGGPVDLAQAVASDGSAGAHTALVADKFQAGYQRAWQDGHGDEILVVLYRFGTHAGAVTYLRRQDASNTTSTVVHFQPSGIPGAHGYRETGHTSQGTRTVVDIGFTNGPYVAQVATVGPSPTTKVAGQVANQQYRKL